MNILIVEDELIIAEELSETLEKEGYTVTFVTDNGKDALKFFAENEVDLVLLDIKLKGQMDGIETAQNLMKIKQVPFIYLTAFTDSETVESAKKTFPAAYISKPYNLLNLRLAVEMAINNYSDKDFKVNKLGIDNNVTKDIFYRVNDNVFLKQHYQFVKFSLNDLMYIKSDGIHTNIITKSKKYAVRRTISHVMVYLQSNLVRVHRSFAINVEKIDFFNEQEITIGGIQIPLSQTYKDDFFKTLQYKE